MSGVHILYTAVVGVGGSGDECGRFVVADTAIYTIRSDIGITYLANEKIISNQQAWRKDRPSGLQEQTLSLSHLHIECKMQVQAIKTLASLWQCHWNWLFKDVSFPASNRKQKQEN